MINTLFGGTKLWAIFPPTAHNLEKLTMAYRMSGRFSQYCSELQGGVLVEQHDGQTLWLPPACLHATFSTQPSMLVGQELRFADDFHRIIDCLPASLTQEDSRIVWDRFAEGLVASLGVHARSEVQIIKAWIANQAFIYQHIPMNIAQKVQRHWLGYLKESKIERCPSCADHGPALRLCYTHENPSHSAAAEGLGTL